MIGVLLNILHSKTLTKTYMTKKSVELENQPVPDLDLKIRGGGGGRLSRPLDKAGPRSPKNFFPGLMLPLKKGGAAPQASFLDLPLLIMI